MAAAYAALVSLSNNLEDIKNHSRHSFSFDKNQIQSLRESVTFLIEFMESYDNCLGPSKDAAQLLERRITCAARAAEEGIESHVVNQIHGGSTLDGKTRSPRFLLDVEKVIQDMDYVRRKAIKVQQARREVEVRQPTYSTPASSSTPLTSQKTTMVGFDHLLLQLLDLLTGHPSSRRVISIVGTGGVGKTTLPDTSNGSRIVVTTRQSDVGDNIGSLPLAVSLLGDDKSWDLFCETVFAGEGCPPELEDVGKNIVRKCRGLPLAIVVVAGHLGKSSRMQECWENAANNMKSVLNSEENKQLFNILSFSYIHLPVHLKPCFVYMGTFPEDKQILISDLIKRWIAEGFVKSCNAENLEENAEDYMKDLIDRNLILDSTQGKYRYCKIHDLLIELCLKGGGEGNVLLRA